MAGRIISKKSILLILCVSAILSFVFISCKKKGEEVPAAGLTEINETEEKAPENEYDFYNPYEDDASWVEALLAQIEEERIAEELAEMENSYSDYQLEDTVLPDFSDNMDSQDDSSGPAEEINPIEKFFEDAEEGKSLRGKNDSLSFFEFQNEVLAPQITENGFVISHAADQNASRYFYDEKYHLIKKEEWIIKSAADAKRIRAEEFVYSEESNKVLQKEIFTDSSSETISYNEESSPLLSKKYIIKDDKRYISQERSWKYNSENKLIKDEQTEYRYKKDDYSSQPETFVKRYEYTYLQIGNASDAEKDSEEDEQKDEIPPDSNYYENNGLKMRYIYTDKKGTYYTWIYFDEAFSVKTNYVDDIKVNEEFYNNGRLIRKKVYDKMD